jgi:hypothetical protein
MEAIARATLRVGAQFAPPTEVMVTDIQGVDVQVES